MTKPKTLDQLRAEKERAETQLAQEKHKLERLEKMCIRDRSRICRRSLKRVAVFLCPKTGGNVER